jgi:hypothetical protein
MATNTTYTAVSTSTTTAVNTISGKTFSSFNTNSDIISDIKQIVTEAVWSNGQGTLTTFATQSSQPAKTYYLDVYDADPNTDDTAEQQFSIAYGNYDGKGAAVVNVDGNDTSLTPSKAIYSQYRNILISNDATKFTINGNSIDDFLVINFYRARIKEKLDPGNWELIVGSGSFIDDSSETTTTTISEGGSSYNIVSGSIVNGVHKVASASVIVGTMFPDHGILLFGGQLIETYGNVTIGRGVNTSANNHISFYNKIVEGASFKARNNQSVTSTFYFVRVLNNEYNFTNNPSFTTGSIGDMRNIDMVNDPKVYISTVGLYNEYNELLAVAKLSQPYLKTFQREALIKIKLDW